MTFAIAACIVAPALFIAWTNQALFRAGKRVFSVRMAFFKNKIYPLIFITLLLSVGCYCFAVARPGMGIFAFAAFALGLGITIIDHVQKGVGAFENGISFRGRYLPYDNMVGYALENEAAGEEVVLYYRMPLTGAVTARAMPVRPEEKEGLFAVLEQYIPNPPAETEGY